jgi:hypothetical protein
MSKTDFNEGRRHLKIRDREDYFRSELLNSVMVIKYFAGAPWRKELIAKVKRSWLFQEMVTIVKFSVPIVSIIK